MLFVPLWFCTLPAVLSLRCRFFSQNNRPIYECLNVSVFGTEATLSGSVTASGYSRGTILPTVPPGTMTFKIAHTRIKTLVRVGNPEIVTLKLNFCELRAVAADAFAQSTNLKQIDLSHNLLTHFSFDSLAFSPSFSGPPTSGGILQVERLVLAYNRFETIPDLSALHALRDLDISHNQIVRIPDGSLLLPRLEWIDLSHNLLARVQRLQFGGALRIVELDANPWNCDCALRDFVAFQRETLISRSLRCQQPPPLRGMKWDDLALSDFACGPEVRHPLHEVISTTSGDIVTMTCEVAGDPTPTVFWRHNHSTIPLKSDTRTSITAKQHEHATLSGKPTTVHALIINAVTTEDENTYWCVARAGYNMIRKRFDLFVLSPQLEMPSNTDFRDLFNGGAEFSSSKHEEEMPLQDEDGSQERKRDGKEADGVQTVLARQHPVWTVVLISVVVLACILLLAFCIFVFRMHMITPEDRNGDQKRFIVGEQVVTQDGASKHNTTTKGALPIVRLHNVDDGVRTELLNHSAPLEDVTAQRENESTQVVRKDSSEPHCRSRLDEWTPKAPLAQYDTDTSVLPIVQTSL
ncbi:Leucine-rich repeat-containing protein 24 [Toxocara canis]|uniref:Leucine-rich repeat-containing protein 24 n=1 Tax=Toxocara canis TaxID=6265 RepID=A0A0B2VGU1_TOXCA|nr:Leucine-rich repeat-containing protein 24 [Toxocara canis]